MPKKPSLLKCLSCGKSEQETPLIFLRFNRGESWICPQCLPVLIHHRDQLAEKLAAISKETPA